MPYPKSRTILLTTISAATLVALLPADALAAASGGTIGQRPGWPCGHPGRVVSDDGALSGIGRHGRGRLAHQSEPTAEATSDTKAVATARVDSGDADKLRDQRIAARERAAAKHKLQIQQRKKRQRLARKRQRERAAAAAQRASTPPTVQSAPHSTPTSSAAQPARTPRPKPTRPASAATDPPQGIDSCDPVNETC